MKLIVYLLAIGILCSCKGKSPSPMTDQELSQAQKNLIVENKRQHAEEMKTIKALISERGWPMIETPTGLHYMMVEPGTGKRAEKDEHVFIAYTIRLLDGTVCYEANASDAKEIHIGHDNIEIGLHEAMQLMHEGEKARFIFPSHLAFGFTGDSRKIPQNASLIYEIQLLRIQR